ncbi:MAG: hypothetical protein KBD26_01010 [Candidatus Pacebacteria bacterium]|nr:hypothetical protein [Candidatus Paceibacterota bacterium]
MFSRHFFRMLIALIGMILLGFLGIFLANQYEKSKTGSQGASLYDL